jgi:glutamyl-tRNA(Gln) amidotransferase subunit D
MHGESSDSFTFIHPGTKARKFHTSRRDAFKTVNSEPIGKVADRKIDYSPRKNKPRGCAPELDTKMEEKVFLLKCYPGLKPEVIDHVTGLGYKGILLEGTGLGHTSETLFTSIKNAAASGVIFAMASQTIYGRVDMDVYSTGRMLLDMGVIPCQDMLPETAYVKLIWVLGHTKEQKKAAEMMGMNYAGEMTGRTLID